MDAVGEQDLPLGTWRSVGVPAGRTHVPTPIGSDRWHLLPVQDAFEQGVQLAGALIQQARQGLITPGLIPYQRPLYQVLALDAPPRAVPPRVAPVAADESVDIQAVFARIWEVLG